MFRKSLLTALALLIPMVAFAQPNPNGHQFFQPAKANYVSRSSDFWPSEKGAVEIWRFDMASGDLVSEILGDTYTQTSTTPDYNAGGPAGTNLDSVDHNSTYWLDTTCNASLRPGSNNFTLVFVLRNSNGDSDFVIWDFDSTIGTTEGVYIGNLGATSGLFIIAHDGTSSGQYQWTDANGATAMDDGQWHHYRITFNKDIALPGLKLDGVSQTIIKTAGSDLSSIGAISPTGGCALGAQENNGGRTFSNDHQYSYLVYATGLNYNTPLLP